MRVQISCPFGREQIPIDVNIPSSGEPQFQLPHFCAVCRVSYAVPDLRKMDEDVLFEVSEYERMGQLDSFEGDEYGGWAA